MLLHHAQMRRSRDLAIFVSTTTTTTITDIQTNYFTLAAHVRVITLFPLNQMQIKSSFCHIMYMYMYMYMSCRYMYIHVYACSNNHNCFSQELYTPMYIYMYIPPSRWVGTYKNNIWTTSDRNEIWARDLHHSTELVEVAKSLALSNVKGHGN